MAKAPVAASRTAPMPANMTAPTRPSTVEQINPPNQNPVGEAEAEQGSQVQNAPTDDEKAAALLTPEGQQAEKEAQALAAAQANEDARKLALASQDKIIANAKVEPLSPANAFKGESTATMISPREFYVLLQDGRRVQFKKGPQEVCQSLQDHSYVKAHGVEPYTK